MAKDKDIVGPLIEVVCHLSEGRELLNQIDAYCGYGKTVFNADSPPQNAFNQGKQSVANWLHKKHEQQINKAKYENSTNDE